MKKILIIPWIPSCCFSFFEKQLIKMNKNGWDLYYYWGPFYIFRKIKKIDNGGYFVHSLHTGAKESSYFSFELRHPFYIEKLSNKNCINLFARKRHLTIIQLKNEIDFVLLRELQIERQVLQFYRLVQESAVQIFLLFGIWLFSELDLICIAHWILLLYLLLLVAYLLFSAIITWHVLSVYKKQ